MKHIIFGLVLMAGLSTVGPRIAAASATDGTIVSSGNSGYAWSSRGGWINFGATNGALRITDAGITGYAWNTNYGWINMDPANGGVSIDENGALSGFAWGESLGWIEFTGVSIDESGRFGGQARGVIIGTVSFDCENCSVVTDYRPAIFRSAVSAGGGGGPLVAASGVLRDTRVAERAADRRSAEAGTEAARSGFGEADAADDGLGGASADTSASSAIGTAPTGVDEVLLPAQLFDIRLLVNDTHVARLADLVARVTFESFGRVPTPVAVTFSVVDGSGKIAWTGEDTVTVETEYVLVKRFSDMADAPELPPGTYVLKAHTRYHETVEDDFEASFSIIASDEARWIFWLLGGTAAVLALLTGMWFLIGRRRQMQEKAGLDTPYI